MTDEKKETPVKTKAESGDSVQVHYTGKLEDGTVFDSSRDKEPFEFKLGEGMVISGFEDAVLELEIGETKTVNIPNDKAYGPHHPQLVMEADLSQFEGMETPKVGMMFQIQREDGDPFNVVVVEVTESKVSLDANHPLAGKDLVFEIELLAIV